ncbi:hypothetical protein G7046_g7581 [Stylonectria norvegica]|nr:hypothetical protein G7046_g7581 [Stylonectria norvegica]
MGVLFYLKAGTLYKAFRSNQSDDDISLVLFSSFLVGKAKSDLFVTLKERVELRWYEIYDTVNPFGDSREFAIDSVWTFDLERDLLILGKPDGVRSASLSLARKRKLTLSDFNLSPPPQSPPSDAQVFPEPYWDPELRVKPRQKSYLGRLLRDFAHTWRHILRSRYNDITFRKLAYATARIASMNFDVVERADFGDMKGDMYVWIDDLPSWDSPDTNLIDAGKTWFALSQDTWEGLDRIRNHLKERDAQNIRVPVSDEIFVILTLRHIVLCKSHKGRLEWTQPEVLFDGEHIPSDCAIDMLLWATDTEVISNSLSSLPVEIQDRILYFVSLSSVAPAKMGCEIGLGSSYTWFDKDEAIELEVCKRRRKASTPTESQICFDGILSGLSYKPQRKPLQVPKEHWAAARRQMTLQVAQLIIGDRRTWIQQQQLELQQQQLENFDAGAGLDVDDDPSNHN